MNDASQWGPGADPDPASAASVSAAAGRSVWRHAGGTAYVESAERVVVLDLDHLDLPPYVFEGTAAQVWLCLDGHRSETEVVADLAEIYDVPAELVATDVRQFVERLRALGLVVAGPVGGDDG